MIWIESFISCGIGACIEKYRCFRARYSCINSLGNSKTQECWEFNSYTCWEILNSWKLKRKYVRKLCIFINFFFRETYCSISICNASLIFQIAKLYISPTSLARSLRVVSVLLEFSAYFRNKIDLDLFFARISYQWVTVCGHT